MSSDMMIVAGVVVVLLIVLVVGCVKTAIPNGYNRPWGS